MLPKVTILMPIYNSNEIFLRQSIESILNQTYKNFEFLIIDDGSTNNCIDIVKTYNDSRIKIVTNEKNLNLATSLNKGIDIAKGEYIARMDDDDISYPQRLEKQITFMDKNKDVGICGTWIKTKHGTWKTPTNSNIIKCNLFFKNCIAHPSVIIRKEMINKFNLRYNEKYKNSQDYELWTRCSTFFKLANLDEVLLDYRFNKKQIKTYLQGNKQKFDITTRNNILSNLGIDPSNEEKELHKILCVDNYSFKFRFRKNINLWINKIIKANEIHKKFPIKEFKEMINSQISVKKYILNKIKRVIYRITLLK